MPTGQHRLNHAKFDLLPLRPGHTVSSGADGPAGWGACMTAVEDDRSRARLGVLEHSVEARVREAAPAVRAPGRPGASRSERRCTERDRHGAGSPVVPLREPGRATRCHTDLLGRTWSAGQRVPVEDGRSRAVPQDRESHVRDDERRCCPDCRYLPGLGRMSGVAAKVRGPERGTRQTCASAEGDHSSVPPSHWCAVPGRRGGSSKTTARWAPGHAAARDRIQHQRPEDRPV